MIYLTSGSQVKHLCTLWRNRTSLWPYENGLAVTAHASVMYYVWTLVLIRETPGFFAV